MVRTIILEKKKVMTGNKSDMIESQFLDKTLKTFHHMVPNVFLNFILPQSLLFIISKASGAHSW